MQLAALDLPADQLGDLECRVGGARGGGDRADGPLDEQFLVADDDDGRRTLTIVGDDEADASAGRIGWSAPLARSLIGAKVGDERIVRLPNGEKSYEVLSIRYPG